MSKIIYVLILVLIISCKKETTEKTIKSFIKNENILSSKRTVLTVNNKIETKNNFQYGENIVLYFENFKGFVEKDSIVFPGMKILVLNKKKDTVLFNEDLYKERITGFKSDPLSLTTSINFLKPFESNENYDLIINIWDKEGEGTLDANFKFDVSNNKHIISSVEKLSFKGVYLYSENQQKVINTNEINLYEKMHIVYEGLDGFNEKDGKLKMGLSIIAKDADNKELINLPDVFDDEWIDSKEIGNQVSANIVFNTKNVKNPIKTRYFIWDKNGKASIESNVNFEMKN